MAPDLALTCCPFWKSPARVGQGPPDFPLPEPPEAAMAQEAISNDMTSAGALPLGLRKWRLQK